jgi:hypothetical protein
MERERNSKLTVAPIANLHIPQLHLPQSVLELYKLSSLIFNTRFVVLASRAPRQFHRASGRVGLGIVGVSSAVTEDMGSGPQRGGSLAAVA